MIKIPFPNKKYNIIYADPPWSYKDKALSGKRGACCKYNIMKKEDIENLPVKEISDNDCILFLWVTMPKLNEAFVLIKAWGPEYRDWETDRKSTRLNSSHRSLSRMPSSA